MDEEISRMIEKAHERVRKSSWSGGLSRRFGSPPFQKEIVQGQAAQRDAGRIPDPEQPSPSPSSRPENAVAREATGISSLL